MRTFIPALLSILPLLLSPHAMALQPADLPLIVRNAEGGSDAAQVLLATAYLDGDGGLAPDAARAAHWFELAALQGNRYAEERIADLYLAGRGVPANAAVAFDWMLKAAERGNLQAQVKLARMLIAGQGVTADPVRARTWLERAATEGNAEAQYELGRLAHAGARSEAERQQARTWLERAALQGYKQAAALIKEITSLGYGADEEWHHRQPDIERLARDGDVEAAYQLARRYESGTSGYHQDRHQALLWYLRAAEGGKREAMAVLARIYANGEGVARDPDTARRWAEAASVK